MPLSRILLVVLAALAAAPAAAAEGAARTQLAAPQPDWDNPRRIILQLTDDDPRKINGVLFNAVNLQKFYGQDNVRIAVIAYAGGMQALLKQASPVAERVASLQQYGVEFVGCGNTLDAIGRTSADLLPGVTLVEAGIAEIVERTLAGWVHIVP